MTDQALHNSIQDAFNWRYATKRFDPTKKIPSADWKVLEGALQMAPSSFGLQPWHFIVINNPELRTKLQPHSWNQPQIVEASHLVVLAAKTSVDTSYIDSFLNQLCAERGVAAETTHDRFYNKPHQGRWYRSVGDSPGIHRVGFPTLNSGAS